MVDQHGPRAGAGLPRRFVIAATIGNGLEFYDFITYAFFAIQIGHAFFPSQSAYGSLMLSLATFGAGFITRPLGGLVIGAYADRVGRKPAMMLSFTMMGAAIIALALIPSYKTIGVAAPVLAVLARMVQGFSLGGEVGPTTAYLLEAAPLNRRGLAVSWQGASQAIAASLGGLVGVGLSMVMGPAALDAYGWRIAFLLGAVTLPFGLWVRRGLVETLHAPDPTAPKPVARNPIAGIAGAGNGLAVLVENRRIIVLALLALGAGTISTYGLQYLTTFAENTLHMAPGVSFLAQTLGNLAAVAALLLGGWLSDRLGRRPIMIWPNLAYLILIMPVFFWMVSARSALVLIAGAVLLGLMSNLAGGAFFTAVTETLPKRIRSRAFATIYASSIALCGGTAQLVITWLIQVTGNPMAPAWYLLGATAVGQLALMLILESAPVKAPLAVAVAT
ncbi:MAG TPA: MFS transporter [Caulobacteraceae bacterium]|nr:MFS transporter [Caulobacteraceae bacterium]